MKIGPANKPGANNINFVGFYLPNDCRVEEQQKILPQKLVIETKQTPEAKLNLYKQR
jgi:hypothetical protein